MCVCVSKGLNNAVALDFHYAENMIYWTDVTTQGSMIRRMPINDSDNVQVRANTNTNTNTSPSPLFLLQSVWACLFILGLQDLYC